MKVKLVTPEKTLFEGDAAYVQVCGTQGEFGVLPNHEPLVSALKEGNIAIELENGEKREFYIKNGVAEVRDNNITLLVGAGE